MIVILAIDLYLRLNKIVGTANSAIYLRVEVKKGTAQKDLTAKQERRGERI